MFGGRRGSSCCTGCGSYNGNRAQSCKTCGVSLRKKAKYEQEKAQPNNDVSGLLSSEEAVSLKSVYSVRVRDQGPDYRCFVSLGRDGSYKCHFRDCIMVQDARSRSFSAGALVCLVSMLI